MRASLDDVVKEMVPGASNCWWRMHLSNPTCQLDWFNVARRVSAILDDRKLSLGPAIGCLVVAVENVLGWW